MLIDVNFQNIVSTTSLGRHVDLEKLHGEIKKKTMVVRWNPQIFPGLRYQPTQTAQTARTFAVIFATGKIVLTAAQDRGQIAATWNQVWKDIQGCTTDAKITHTELVKKRRTLELNYADVEEDDDDFFRCF